MDSLPDTGVLAELVVLMERFSLVGDITLFDGFREKTQIEFCNLTKENKRETLGNYNQNKM